MNSSLVVQMVKNPPAMQETWVRSLGWERRGEWQPTPVLWPGESHEWRSLPVYSPCGYKESRTIEQLSLSLLANIHLNISNLPAEYFTISHK